MSDRTEKLIEEVLDRVVRLETRMCKLMEALHVPVDRSSSRPAVFKYRNGVDISEKEC